MLACDGLDDRDVTVVARSTDHGRTFSHSIVDTNLENPDETLPGVFIGDYSAIAVGADLRLHPCWTDFRGRPGATAPNQDAYTQSISFLS